MAGGIKFNNVPDNLLTPGVVTEVDKSRALKGLAANPHKVLLVGQKISAGSKALETLQAITSDGLADGYFGPGSILARMCNIFKQNNPNTELFAIALSNNGGVKASGVVNFSGAISHNTGSLSTDGEKYRLLINGSKVFVTLTSGWSLVDMKSGLITAVNANSNLPVVASDGAAASGEVHLIAVQSGTLGNYVDVRANYFEGDSDPTSFGDSAAITALAGGSVDPDLGDAWAVVDGEQFHYIGNPYIDADNLESLENELAERFKPLIDQWGHGVTGVRATLASDTTLTNSRNSPHNTIMGANGSPSAPEEWAAANTAQASLNLNDDPARPLHFIDLEGILPPALEDRFNQAERNILLTDGAATFVVDVNGNVQIERFITTYQTDSNGIDDSTYLDVQTLATLAEIRYQYKARMTERFIKARKKLADDGFPVQPGSNVVTPEIIKRETIAVFGEMQTAGLIENLDDFIENLVVERDPADRNRVNVLLPPDLVNQLRVLAGLVQFIL